MDEVNAADTVALTLRVKATDRDRIGLDWIRPDGSVALTRMGIKLLTQADNNADTFIVSSFNSVC